MGEATKCLPKMVGVIHYAIYLNKSPWHTGSKTAPKHQLSTAIFDGRCEVLFLVCIPLLMPSMRTVYVAKRFHSLLTHAVPVVVWQTPNTWICWLLSVRTFFMPPFQRACWYGDGVLCLILRLCDPKTQLVCCSWTVVLGFFFTIFLTVRGDNLLPLPGKFQMF